MVTDKYRLVIGKFCSIAFNVQILVDMNHPTDWVSTYPFGEMIYRLSRNPEAAYGRDMVIGRGDIVTGNDVWIGQDVLIVPGV
jgi:acetyltransferase-like isoleucine patch superfamily enzyme